MATTINCTQNEVNVYDSLFQYLDRESIQLVETMFHCDGVDPQNQNDSVSQAGGSQRL